MKKPAISIVGAGNLATALAEWLHGAGYRIDEVIVRASSFHRARTLARRLRARVREVENATFAGGIIWLCVPDDAIAACATAFARRNGWLRKIALHSSGALSSEVLAPLRKAGAAVGSVHPMMTFVRGAHPPAAAGIPFAVEGDSTAVLHARRIVRALGGAVVPIQAGCKPLYHALGAFASPLIVAELAIAEGVARAAGVSDAQVRRTIAPILRQTLENYIAGGTAAAFSGPLVRGDLGTIRKHLQVLNKVPHARAVYVALARAALDNLPVKNRAELRRLLQD